jgi:hypothetical protein
MWALFNKESILLDLRSIQVRFCKISIFVSSHFWTEVETKKNGVPSILLKYVSTASFLHPLAKLLPLTNELKNDEGHGRSKYVFSSTFETDGRARLEDGYGKL